MPEPDGEAETWINRNRVQTFTLPSAIYIFTLSLIRKTFRKSNNSTCSTRTTRCWNIFFFPQRTAWKTFCESRALTTQEKIPCFPKYHPLKISTHFHSDLFNHLSDELISLKKQNTASQLLSAKNLTVIFFGAN